MAGLAASGLTVVEVLKHMYTPKSLMRATFVKSKLTIDDKPPKFVKLTKKPWGYIFNYRMLPGMNFDDFKKKENMFGVAFNGEAYLYAEGHNLTIEIYRIPLPAKWYFDLVDTNHFIPLPIGMTRKGLETIDLAKCPHGIIGGESGSGKSVFIRQFITNLAMLKTPQQLEMTLIDLKHGVELGMFKDLPHVRGFARDVAEVDHVLNEVNYLINERGRLFESEGMANIEEYNKRHNMPYRVVIVDELAEIEDTATIQRISRLGRAYGVHMLLTTQRPDAKVLEGQIKANSPLSICFKVKNGVNSRIVLDHEGGKNIPPIPGRCIVQHQGERQAQCMYLDEPTARKVIRRRITELGEEVKTNEEGYLRERPSDTIKYF